ncbi:MAG: methyltransferase [Epsilonproteobacteria bacterium (ex Lamellibrachia satsuma)]|nr:MAG: methyltransferase [Epsilonproteobacteria bacterium (ex Lamellibrachia satsuma)]
MIFSHHTMQEILPILQNRLKTKETVSFKILDPDLGEGYAGEKIIIKDQSYIYRGYKAWTDLAEILKCRMLTPQKCEEPLVTLRFKKMEEDSFHSDTPKSKEEKYGADSHFFQINKMEEPAFLYYYQQALENVKVGDRKQILNLGVNRGDEFEVIRKQLNIKKYEKMEFIGIDHSQSAIEYARHIFPENNFTFYAHDINDIESLRLGRFDLLISIGTLQSPSINFKPFFMSLVQNFLKKDSAVILGFPNCRWIGGEMIYGAKAPNYAMSEMSLLFNDVIFCKKYLQQKKYRVTITGKQYIFLTATKIGL